MKKIIMIIFILSFASCSFVQGMRVKNAINEGRKYFLQGDYREAMLHCSNHLEDFPENVEFKNFCRDVFMNVKTLAGDLYRKGDYKTAGLMYRYLVEYKPKTLKIETEEIQSMKAECIKRLSEKALYNYRKGNLKEAITAWNDLLAIDPSNSEAKKSLSTASIQLKHMKEIQQK